MIYVLIARSPKYGDLDVAGVYYGEGSHRGHALGQSKYGRPGTYGATPACVGDEGAPPGGHVAPGICKVECGVVKY